MIKPVLGTKILEITIRALVEINKVHMSSSVFQRFSKPLGGRILIEDTSLCRRVYREVVNLGAFSFQPGFTHSSSRIAACDRTYWNTST